MERPNVDGTTSRVVASFLISCGGFYRCLRKQLCLPSPPFQPRPVPAVLLSSRAALAYDLIPLPSTPEGKTNRVPARWRNSEHNYESWEEPWNWWRANTSMNGVWWDWKSVYDKEDWWNAVGFWWTWNVRKCWCVILEPVFSDKKSSSWLVSWMRKRGFVYRCRWGNI